MRWQEARQGFPTTVEQEVEQLINRWRREAGYGRRNMERQMLGSLCGSSIAVAMTFIIGLHLLPHSGARPDSGLTLALLALSCGWFAAPFAVHKYLIRPQPVTEIQTQIQVRLNALEDVRAVRPLLDALYASEPLHGTVLSILTRLLPRLPDGEETAALLRPHTRALYAQLKTLTKTHPDFVIAVLCLFPCLADRRCLMETARIVMRDASNADERRVWDAARGAMMQLLARVDLGGLPTLGDWIQRLPGVAVPHGILNTELGLPYFAVMQLLPRCEAANYLALPKAYRINLYRGLCGESAVNLGRLRPDYTLVVLDMIRRSADVQALDPLQALIGDVFNSALDRQVCEAACECIPILQAQLEKERARTSLLRGAGVPQATPDSLLRAANTAPPTDPQLLLRATVQETGVIEPDHSVDTAMPAPTYTIPEPVQERPLYRG
jgi:hypothetical protein